MRCHVKNVQVLDELGSCRGCQCTVLAFEIPKHLGEEEGGFCCAHSQSAFRENHSSQMAADLHRILSFLSPPVCDNLENFTSGSPFLCMDLAYITALLKDGFGFSSSTVLQVRERTPVSYNSPLTSQLGRKS